MNRKCLAAVHGGPPKMHSLGASAGGDLIRRRDLSHGDSRRRHLLKLCFQLERFADGEIGC
jgi:hypothetical protein